MMPENKKPEYMTILSGDRLVPKTHGRIVFRGIVDALQADVIEAQVLAAELGREEICLRLGEIMDFLRMVMAAEVKETFLPPPELFGMNAEEIHRRSHNLDGKTFQFPSYTQGPMAARINKLRTKVREAELVAVNVFGPSSKEGFSAEREDIILAMNRLSSAVWLLFTSLVSATSP
jgi:ethanolamine utilization cobalamin adenosyltransferase